MFEIIIGTDLAGVLSAKGVLADIIHVQGLALGRGLALIHAHIHRRVLTLVHTRFLVPFPGLVHLGKVYCVYGHFVLIY